MRARRQVRRMVYGSCSVILLLVGPFGLLLGNHVTHRPHPVNMRALGLTAAKPAGTTTTTTATMSAGAGTLVTTTASAVSASLDSAASGRAPGTPPAQAPGAPAAGAAKATTAPAFTSTLASWYGGRPEACYDPGQRSPLPAGITMWAASRTIHCGTTVEISGPAGTVRMQIEDHGPWLLPGRDLDLSPLAFTSVAGSLSVGVTSVRFRVVG